MEDKKKFPTSCAHYKAKRTPISKVILILGSWWRTWPLKIPPRNRKPSLFWKATILIVTGAQRMLISLIILQNVINLLKLPDFVHHVHLPLPHSRDCTIYWTFAISNIFRSHSLESTICKHSILFELELFQTTVKGDEGSVLSHPALQRASLGTVHSFSSPFRSIRYLVVLIKPNKATWSLRGLRNIVFEPSKGKKMVDFISSQRWTWISRTSVWCSIYLNTTMAFISSTISSRGKFPLERERFAGESIASGQYRMHFPSLFSELREHDHDVYYLLLDQ